MKTTLSYFTGTGNSLWFAKQLQSRIAECEIRSIAKAIEKDDLTIPEGRVGIVIPLYFYGLPRIVMRLIKESDFSKAQYILVRSLMEDRRLSRAAASNRQSPSWLRKASG
jgi:hypothetical protein